MSLCTAGKVVFYKLKERLSNDFLVELSETKLRVSVFGSDLYFDDDAVIAIQNSDKVKAIVAVGARAKSITEPSCQLVYPFQHSRSFVADFESAERLLQYAIFTLKKSRFRLTSRIIMHQLEKTEGGLTDIGQRVLKELAMAEGASNVLVYSGDRIDVNKESFELVKQRS